MRVAWITTGFSGGEEYNGAAAIHNLAREIASYKDIELTIFSLYYPIKKKEYAFYGAKVLSFAQKEKVSKSGKLSIWRRCMKKFGEEHRKNRFDIIHSMWAGESGLIASRLSKKHHIKLIVSICGGELAYFPDINYGSRTKFWQKRFVDRAFGEANAIVSGSDVITELVKKYYHDDIFEKTLKIPFGVDETLFHPDANKNVAKRPLTLINIANVSPVKDHMTLLKSLLKVRDKYADVTLLHYGKDDKHSLRRMIHELGLEKNVNLGGFINFKEVPDALRKADVFVLSSLYESQNMAIIEAAFCGLPVVSTDAGAAKEITDSIVISGDGNALADLIIRTADNLGEEKKKALNKIEALKKDFTLKASTDKFVKLYRSIIL